MAAASVTRLGHATPEKALMSGGPGPMVSARPAAPLTGFQGTETQQHPPKKDQVSPGYISTRAQLPREQRL